MLRLNLIPLLLGMRKSSYTPKVRFNELVRDHELDCLHYDTLFRVLFDRRRKVQALIAA